MDSLVEKRWVSEGLVRQMTSLQITPDDLDVIEFGRIFGQPLDREPVGTLCERRRCRFADVDRAVVEHQNDGPGWRRGLWAVEAVEDLQMGDEIGAALGGVSNGFQN